MARLEQVSAEDIASIERAARDYIEGYLTGDGERMADCLHAELTKRSVERHRYAELGRLRGLPAYRTP